MSDWMDFFIGIFVGSMLSLVVIASFDTASLLSVRKEAVEAGVAKYKCDEKTGVTEFIWIKPEGESK